MRDFKIGDIVTIRDYYREYGDDKCMTIEELKRYDTELAKIKEKKLSMVIKKISGGDIHTIDASPYMCVVLSTTTRHYFSERELKFVTIKSWRNKICSDNI